MVVGVKNTGELESRNYVSSPIESVPQDIVLPYPVYIWVDKRMVLFRQKSDILTAERVTKLRSKVDTVYIAEKDWYLFLKSLESMINLGGILDDPLKASQEIRNLLYGYEKTLFQEQNLSQATYDKVSELANGLSQCLHLQPQLAPQLLQRFQDPSIYLSNHSINVGVFCAAMGMKLEWPKSKVEKLILSGLFHNVGKIKIPEPILHKDGKLSSEEWEQMKQHPVLGAEILKSLKADPDIIRTTLEHHEQPDGSGYVRGLQQSEISELVSVIAIADVYDALLSQRYWKIASSPIEALEQMKNMEGRFHPNFFRLISK